MASSANREEVDKCKQVAMSALASGNSEKAVRFLEKAKRMAPEDRSLDELIAKAQSGEPMEGAGSPPDGPGPSSAPPAASAEGVRSRARAATAPTGATRTNKDGGKYTAEQSQEVQRILRTKDYYEILNLTKDRCDEDSLKKAYRKLALKLHPDKNKAPGAEEAFKKVSKAIQCLQDADKKQVYDRYGDEDSMPQQHRQRHQQDFMTPEDLFAAFFGGGTFQSHGNHHRQQQQHSSEDGGEGVQRAHLFQMLPVLLLVFLTLASNFASKDNGSRFSFTASGHYQVERQTTTVNVNYFVTNDFNQYYNEGTKPLADFERQVEIYYVRQLHSDCDHQERVMYKKVTIAKRRGSQDELQKARNHPRPGCKEIEKIKKRHPSIYRSALYMGGF